MSGFPSAPANISLEVGFNPTHGWGGDIVATLYSPDGTSFVIFGYTGISSPAGTFDGGDGSDLIGPYTFNDAASGNWWTAADTTDDELAIPSGSYRTSEIGGDGSTGSLTNLNAAFASIPTSNGTWILRLTDGCNVDSGGVSSASLTLTAGTPSLPPQQPNVDMNGQGRSDFVVLRGNPAPASNFGADRPNRLTNRQRQQRDIEAFRSGNIANLADFPIQWWTLHSEDMTYMAPYWGDATMDWNTPADFDGDDRSDFAIWRPGDTISRFFWIRSSDLTMGSSVFGLMGDNPTVVGDYDGDNKADPAVYRCPVDAGQCYFFYRGTNNNPNNNITYWPFGYGDFLSVRPYPGDFDGDQKYDFCIYVAHPNVPGGGMFVLQPSGNLGSVEYISYGLVDLDFLVPGDYDGDGRTDFAVARPNNGNMDFYVRERDGGGYPAARIRWGLDDDDIVPGDYDGDGKTDIAVYRWARASGQSAMFWILRSSDGKAQPQAWGTVGDFPAAEWIVQ